MRNVTFAILIALVCIVPLSGQEKQTTGALDEVVSKVIARENQEMGVIRQHSPIVETYIQKIKVTETDGSWKPDGDHYFIGRAQLSKGTGPSSLWRSRDDASLRHGIVSLAQIFDFGARFLPKGFLQMIHSRHQRPRHPKLQMFDYVRREFLGEVRTLVSRRDLVEESSQGPLCGANLGWRMRYIR